MHQIMYYEYPVTCKFKDIIDDVLGCVANNGDHYGTESVRIPTETVFDTYDKAKAYIEHIDKGDYDGIAVKYRDYSGFKPTAKILEYREKSAELRRKWQEYINEHSVHKQKAEFISCRGCHSKLRNSMFGSERCPICGKDLRSQTTLDRIASFDNRIAEINKKIKAEEMKQKEKANVKWLVKFEFHC